MATAEQKGKKPRTDPEEGERIDGALLLSIEKLQEIQDKIERVNEEASDKVLEVEQKYNEIRRLVYGRRNEIIKEIPDFWLTAFLSHPMLGELLTEDDQKIFKHLESINVGDSKDIKSGCSITLIFSSNPYFQDTKLTKTYSFSDDGTTTVKATSIKWKDGMDIGNGKAYTKKGDKRLLVDERFRRRRASSGHRRIGRRSSRSNRAFRELPARSFFIWFNDAKNKTLAHGVMDEVGDIIKEELWPNPLKYFNNDAEDEFEGEDDDEDGYDDDEEED